MSYTRECKTCGQRISLRQMPDGQWVAFDVSTQNVHEHYKETSAEDNHIYTKKTSKKNNVWSGDDDDMLEEFFEEGKSIDYIANYFKVSTTFVFKKLDELGYVEPAKEQKKTSHKKNIPKSTPGELWTDDEEEYLLSAKEEGLSNYEIAKELGRTVEAIKSKYKTINTSTSKIKSLDKHYNNEKLTSSSATIAKYIYKAVENQKILIINYEKNDGTQSIRTIYPVKVHQYQSSYSNFKKNYLEAYCTLRKDNRMFSFTNITKLELLTTEFAGSYFPYMKLIQEGENVTQEQTPKPTSKSTKKSKTKKTNNQNYSNTYSSEDEGLTNFLSKYWFVTLIVFIVLYGVFFGF